MLRKDGPAAYTALEKAKTTLKLHKANRETVKEGRAKGPI